MKTKEIASLEACVVATPKRCSDYDEDCKDVACPMACHAGGTFACRVTGEIGEMDRADGYCPRIH